MSTIKEIAQRTGLSPGTISIVLNGRGDEMRISKETQQRVLEAAKGAGYLPNVSARRLRQPGARNVPVIAAFCPPDIPSDLLGRFFAGIQSSSLEQEYAFEVTIHSYKHAQLHKIKEKCDSGTFHGAILTGISDEGQRELERYQLDIPLVFFNRKSEVYSSVYVDSYEIGRKTAALFAKRGHRKVGTIVPDYQLHGSNNQRFRGFVESCERYGLALDERNIQSAPMTMEGGNLAARNMLSNGADRPTAIYFPIYIMAVAALPVFHLAGIRIPDMMEIMTYGNQEIVQYTVPSLSTVHLPIEEMSAACVRLVMGMITGTAPLPRSVRYETPFTFRESCGGFLQEG